MSDIWKELGTGHLPSHEYYDKTKFILAYSIGNKKLSGFATRVQNDLKKLTDFSIGEEPLPISLTPYIGCLYTPNENYLENDTVKIGKTTTLLRNKDSDFLFNS